jgi:hypothetical protein
MPRDARRSTANCLWVGWSTSWPSRCQRVIPGTPAVSYRFVVDDAPALARGRKCRN